jgi:hypothetical protein
MAYQDDFRNKVLDALKKRNLAVDISAEETQKAIIEETEILASSESRPLSPEEKELLITDVAKQVSVENQHFSAQSVDGRDFIAFAPQEDGAPPGGSYSGGGIAVSVMNKDILIIPTAGTATSINTLSQIDFKIISNPNAYGVIDPNEVKSSLYNWGERVSGNTYDTPVLGLGGAWNGISYTPTSQWGLGASQGSGIAGSISVSRGFGQIIYFKPASSTIYSGLFNDLGINVSYSTRSVTLTGYDAAIPGAFPTAGFAVTFGGIGNSGDLAILGATTESQTNTIRFLSPLTISNSTATDTLTLGLSSATSTVQNFVGGGSAQYNLSTTTSSFSAGDLFYASGTGHVTLTRLTLGANNTYLSSNGSAPFWTSSIAANTVSVNAATGTTVLYPLLNNVAGSGSAVSTDVDFSVDPGNNILRYATGSFYVGTAVSSPTFTAPGAISIKPGADSTTAIQLDNAAGTPVINVNTTNSRVGINNVTAPAYTLDVAGDTNISSGSVYRINTTQVLSSTQVFGVTISSSVITGGSWSATAITAFYGGTGQVSYTAGDLLYANTTSTLAKLGIGTNGTVLTSTGSAPQWTVPATLSVGFAVTSANQYVAQSSNNADAYITFVNGVTTAPVGVGLSVSNASSQLTYNPSTQQLKVTNITGTAFTATNLTGTLLTAAQNNITSASSLATVGNITSGNWSATAIGTTYGGTGSNLGPSGAIGNSNRIIVTGSTGPYAASLINNATSGYLLVSGGALAAPTFTNTTSAAFTFSSGTLTVNDIALTTGTITNPPGSANDIVNKAYADSISAGLDIHDSARYTTLSAIGGSYRQSGTAGTLSGLGDYIIATIPGTLIGSESGWDTGGTALTNGQRVLVKDGVLGGYASGSGAYGAYPTTYGGFASSWVANGIYEVASFGGAATSGWLLVRAIDSDNGNGLQELTGGTFLFIEEGTNYADHAFVCSNDTISRGPIGFGSTQIAWTLFAGGNTLIAGQGLVESGNNIALLFNLTQANAITAGSLSRGFTLGGTRAASLGSSSLITFTVTGDANSTTATNTFTANATGFSLSGGQTSNTFTLAGSTTANTLTGNADGFTLQGGTTARTINVIGGNILLNGAGFGLTLGSQSVLSTNGQSLIVSSNTGNVTFTGSANNATTQNIVTSGTAQYQLSTATSTFASGDLYYNSGASFAAMTRLALASGTGASVLIRNTTAPVWGTINLASSDFVSGVLPINNGGTNGTATPTQGGVSYGTGTAYAFTTAGSSGNVLISAGTSAPSFGAITLSNSNSVTGVLPLANGGTNNNLSAISGAVAYSDASKIVLTNAGTAGSVLISNGTNPLFSSINLASSNAVNGTLGISNGGTNATSFTTTNGVLVYNGTSLVTGSGLSFTGGAGLTVIGTVNSTGGFFTGGNSVVTSITPFGGSAIYGAVTINVANTNPAGALTVSGSSQTITITGPATGITGTGANTQVSYFNATREQTGDVGFVYSRTAATGIGLSLNINASSGTVLRVNTAQALTSGLLLDVDNNGTQAFSIDFKGMGTHAAASGNTALIMTGGRTVFASATTNYATLGLTATGTDPSAPNVGDLWYNGTNLYFRKTGGTNHDLLIGSVSGSGTANRVAKWSSASALTDSNISDAGVGMTITATSAVGVGAGSTAYLTIQSLSGDEVAGIKNSAYFVRGVSAAGAKIFSVDVAGNLRATTKSFDIPHPTKEGSRLVYGVLEGPEHGVYHRGTIEGKGIITVNLPEYWHKLVGDNYTIQLTPWGNYNVGISNKTENYFTIQLVGDPISRKFKHYKVDYIVHGSRLDAPLDIEQ